MTDQTFRPLQASLCTRDDLRRSSRPGVLAGITGGVVGATCCIGPAVGIALGLGSGSFLRGLGQYRPYWFIVGGLVAFTVAALFLRRARPSCAIESEVRVLRLRILDATLLAFALTYAVGRLVLPRIIERL